MSAHAGTICVGAFVVAIGACQIDEAGSWTPQRTGSPDALLACPASAGSDASLRANLVESDPGFVTIDRSPVLSIGTIDGDDGFGQIDAAVFVGEDLVVADGLTNELSAVSLDTGERRLLGGPGEGPGEFTRLGGIAALGDSAVVASDGDRLTRISLASGEAVTVRTSQRDGGAAGPGSVRINAQLVGSTGGDTVLLAYPRFGGARSGPPPGESETSAPPPTELVWATLGEGEFSAAGSLTRRASSVHTFDDEVLYARPQPFGPEGFAAVGAGVGYRTQGRTYQITRFEPGGDSSHIAICNLAPARLSDQMIRSHVDAEVAAARSPDRVAGLLRNIDYPHFAPAFATLFVDPSGRLWAEDRNPSAPGTWRVFAPDGEWLTTVEMPDGELVAVGRDHVAVRVDLGMDVQGLRIHRVTMETPGSGQV